MSQMSFSGGGTDVGFNFATYFIALAPPVVNMNVPEVSKSIVIERNLQGLIKGASIEGRRVAMTETG